MESKSRGLDRESFDHVQKMQSLGSDNILLVIREATPYELDVKFGNERKD